jgi:phosphoribosylanthranilate isomerase
VTRVKLCGLTSREHLEVAAEAGASHVGLLVQAPASHRDLPIEAATELAAAAPDGLAVVLVTPSGDADAVVDAAECVAPRAVQATGALDERGLRAALPDAVDLWRGRRLAGSPEATLEDVDQALTVADAVVLDALEDGYGGTGETLDWDHAARVVDETDGDVVLAGGLTPGNVAEAIRRVDPWCVDVSSGIETDQANDPDRMRALARAAREVTP